MAAILDLTRFDPLPKVEFSETFFWLDTEYSRFENR